MSLACLVALPLHRENCSLVVKQFEVAHIVGQGDAISHVRQRVSVYRLVIGAPKWIDAMRSVGSRHRTGALYGKWRDFGA